MCARLHVLVALILTVQKRLCLVARARVAGNEPVALETAARLLRHGELLGGRSALGTWIRHGIMCDECLENTVRWIRHALFPERRICRIK